MVYIIELLDKRDQNMTSPNENNNFPVTDVKEMEICELPEKEFKMIILKKLSKIQGNIDRQLNELRKTIQEKMRTLTMR